MNMTNLIAIGIFRDQNHVCFCHIFSKYFVVFLIMNLKWLGTFCISRYVINSKIAMFSPRLF